MLYRLASVTGRKSATSGVEASSVVATGSASDAPSTSLRANGLRIGLPACFVYPEEVTMNRPTILFAGFLLAAGPLACAQESQPPSQSPEDALVVQQLVAWTRVQKPQPAPQPLPPRDQPVPQPDQQDRQGKPTEPQTHSEQTPTTQSFTGKILKDGSKYVLKVAANTTYELQDAGEVGQYENQAVKVIGSLDSGTNTIRVIKIELLS
jgi:Protein of unknown function (DUF5818)